MPKKVLQVFASLNVGGAESRMMDIFRRLDPERVHFDFLVMTPGEHYFEREILDAGGRVFKIENPRSAGVLKNIENMRRLMEEERFDAVHSHTSYHSGLSLLAAKRAGVGIRIAHARTTGTLSAGAAASMMLGRLLIKTYATDMLCVSKNAGVFLFGKGAIESGKAVLMPNAIDLDSFNDNAGELDGEVAAFKGDSLLIGCIGRFAQMKNQGFLVELLSEMLEMSIDCKLVFVGGGDLLETVKKQAEEAGVAQRVLFTGVRSDIPRLMNCFDVLAMPSIYEGLGNVAVEAQAAGISCVVSDALPNEIDMGLGLVKRLSLEQPKKVWAQAMVEMSKKKCLDRKKILDAFSARKYTIEDELNGLYSIYERENRRK